MTRIKFLIYSLAVATLLVACGQENGESKQGVSDEILQNELNEFLFAGITEMDSLPTNPISARIIITDKINPEVREVALLLVPDLIKHFDADLRSSLALMVEGTFKNGRKEVADIPFPETDDASDFENQIADFLVRCLDSSDSKKSCSITVVLS